MARIMVAAITSLWVALVMTGCSSTSASALMRPRAMRPEARAPWDEGSALSLSLSLSLSRVSPSAEAAPPAPGSDLL
jgi:hypothetical protein